MVLGEEGLGGGGVLLGGGKFAVVEVGEDGEFVGLWGAGGAALEGGGDAVFEGGVLGEHEVGEAEGALHGDLFVEGDEGLEGGGGGGAADAGDFPGGGVEGEEHGVGDGAEAEGVEGAAVALGVLFDEPGFRAVGGGFFEEVCGGGGEDAASAEGGVEEAAGGELDVAHGFGGDAEAGAAGEEAVAGIAFAEGGVEVGVLLVGGAGGDELVYVFEVPAGFHELHGEPVEEGGVGGLGGLHAEVLGGFEEAEAEVGLPDAVDLVAGGGGRVGIGEPLGEGEARGGIACGEGVEEGGDVWLDLLLGVGLFAALEEVGGAWFLDGGGDEGGGGDGVLLPEGFDFCGGFGEGGVAFAPVGEESGGLFGSALVRWCFEGFADEGGEVIEGVGKGRGELEEEAAEVVALHIVGVVAAVFLDEGEFEVEGAGVEEGFGEVEGDELGVIGAAGAEVGAPGGFFIAVEGIGGGSGDAVVWFAAGVLRVAGGVESGVGRVDGGNGVGELELGEFGGFWSALEFEFAEGAGALAGSAGALEGEVGIVEEFEADGADLGERGGEGEVLGALGGGVAHVDHGVVLEALVSLAGVAELGELHGVPLGGGEGQECVLPGLVGGPGVGECAFEGGDLLFQPGDFALFVGSVGGVGGFAGAVEEGEDAVVFLLSEGVEFVAVALGALHGETEDGFADGVHAVDDAFDAELFGIGATFLVGHGMTEEAGGDVVVLGGVGEEIAGDLADDEVVVGHVVVHGLHDPVAVEVHFAGEVLFVAGGIGVAGRVEPFAGPAFAEVGGGEEGVDRLFDGPFFALRATKGDLELAELVQGRGEAGEVEGEAAKEGVGGSGRGRFQAFGFEAGEDEVVDGVLGPGGVFDRGDGGAFGGLEGPVFAPRGAFLDPAGEELDLFGFEAVLLLGWRHEVVGIVGGDAFEEEGLGGFAGDDGGAGLAPFEGAGAEVEAEFGFDRFRIGAVACEAVVGKDGSDLRGEIDRCGGGGEEQEEGDGRGAEHHVQAMRECPTNPMQFGAGFGGSIGFFAG